jgi:uncharacterized protein (TIGR02594 family)
MTYQEFQRGLIALGYDLGPAGADGVPGRMSTAATVAFKRSHGLSATPAIGPLTLNAMRTALRDRPSTRPIRDAIVKQEVTKGGLEPVWLIEARRWIGEREVPGPKSNPRLLSAIRRVGARILGIDYVNDDTAWCGAILAAWLSITLPAEVLPSIAVRAKSWASFGVRLSAPALGAIMVYDRKGGGHVALYVGETATDWLLLGGNQGNKVSIMRRSKALGDPIAIRWPRSVPLPRGGRVMTNAAGVPVGLSEA